MALQFSKVGMNKKRNEKLKMINVKTVLINEKALISHQ